MRLREIANLVTAEIPQAPMATVVVELCMAARELCSLTGVWTETLTAVPAQAQRTRYAFNVPDGAEIARVDRVWVGGKQIGFKDPADARASVNEGCTDAFWWAPNLFDLNLNPAPTPGVLIVVDACLRPRFGAEIIPDEIAAGRERILAQGAAAALFDLADKEWTNHDLAALRRKQFMAGVHGVGVDVALGGGNADTLSVESYDVR